MKRIIYVITLIVLVISTCACSNKAVDQNNSVIESENQSTSFDKIIKQEETPQKSESGFDETANQMINIHGIQFSIPVYYIKEDSTEDSIHYYLEGKRDYCLLSFKAEDADMTQENFDIARPTLDDQVIKIATEIEGDDAELVNAENILIAGVSGRKITCSIKAEDGITTTVHVGVVFNADNNKVISVWHIYKFVDQINYDCDGDFTKILQSAKLLPLEAQSPLLPSDSNLNDDIRPAFKQAMDSYEAFFDEYIAFMNEYQNADNAIEMLADYFDYMTNYSKNMEILENMDTGDMSSAELAYYTEAMNRINQKLYNSILS